MDADKVDMFIMTNGKYFESYQLESIRQRLLTVDNSRWAMLSSLQLKDPTTSLIISILAGSFGIDRFLIGDVGVGIGKLVTCGGFGVWTIVDWFLIQDATRQKNMEMLSRIL